MSYRVVAELLHDLGYSLQANRKTLEGRNHPDRNAQFEHIDGRVRAQIRAGQPVISVDTKKKELVGDFKNGGREWQPQGRARAGPRARLHRSQNSGKAIPYGVYDMAPQPGLGQRGHRPRHRAASRSTTHPALVAGDGAAALSRGHGGCSITADGGGSNGYRVRLWKLETPDAGRRDRASTIAGLPLPAGHQQVEQDRAPAVLVHHPELARQAASRSRHHREAHRGDSHDRPASKFAAVSTGAGTRTRSRSPTPRWRPCGCGRTRSTGSGTTRSRRLGGGGRDSGKWVSYFVAGP